MTKISKKGSGHPSVEDGRSQSSSHYVVEDCEPEKTRRLAAKRKPKKEPDPRIYQITIWDYLASRGI